MINIAICDDEEVWRDLIAEFTKSYINKYNEVYNLELYDSEQSLLEAGIKFDLVFLDVCIEQSNGIEIAHKFRTKNKDAEIIFVTSFIEFAPSAFNVRAFRYILKEQKMLERQIEEAVDAFMQQRQAVTPIKQYAFVEGTLSVAVDRIMYIESNLHYLTFYIMTSSDTIKEYKLREKLNAIEKELGEHDFVRVHNRDLANLKYIKEICKNEVHMQGNIKLPIARNRLQAVKEKFLWYESENIKRNIHSTMKL